MTLNHPRLAPIQSASFLREKGDGGGGKEKERHPPATNFRRRFGASMSEIQARVDAIMLESDENVESDEIAAKKVKPKKLRAAKKGRKSLVATSAKKERMDKLEAKKEAKRKDREKDKKSDKKKRAWSKAGISQKEVLDILMAFRAIDEDLTGEIDPKEFFALPQFSSFASPETMDTLFRAMDRDGSGTVTETELLSVMFPLATKGDVQEMIKMAHRVRFGSKKEEKEAPKLSEEDRRDIETIFNMYDTDNSNTVSLTELLEALGEKLRNIMTPKEIADIFETFDTDKNSDLDLEEFITLYEEYFLVPVNEASTQGPPPY
jgi:Ca2+-binding EF-hand superfamily protein